jgi:hypothetical protein
MRDEAKCNKKKHLEMGFAWDPRPRPDRENQPMHMQFMWVLDITIRLLME